MSLSHLDTIELIANDCISKLHPDDATYIAKLDNIYGLHNSYGMHIRNVYGLWHTNRLTERWRTDPSSRDVRNRVDYSQDHPDAISGKVLTLIQLKLKGITS